MLETIWSIIVPFPDGGEKMKELIKELFKDILERAGDRSRRSL
jgi:hypothetical protein